MARVFGMAGIGVAMVGDWGKAKATLGVVSNHFAVQKILEGAMKQEAMRARRLLVEGMRSGAPGGKRFAPHAPSTTITRKYKRRRGSKGNKPLISSGSMVRAINTRHVAGQGSFVGILRSARSRSGKSLVNLMQVHENGKVIAIRVTPAMRAYLMAMFRQAGVEGGGSGGLARGIIIVRIPARPVFEPVWRKHFAGGKAAKRIQAHVQARLLGVGVGLLGAAGRKF